MADKTAETFMGNKTFEQLQLFDFYEHYQSVL